MRMKVVCSLLISLACICSANNVLAKTNAADDGFYTTKDKEYYLSPEQMLFIRPGLNIEFLDVVVPADGQMEVTYSISDPAGLPLDHDGIFTPGAVDMRFTLANIPMGEEQKVRLAYERIDRNGVHTKISDGVYKFKFDYVMDSDPDTTHTLVAGGRRDLREWDLDRYADNEIRTWVPSGMYEPMPRDIVTTDTCNRCHQPLQLHGRWQHPQACTNCHNPTQNTRFDQLIHAVHAATEAGGHDFSEIVFPAEISDCQICHTGGTPTDNFPMVANPSAALVCDASGVGTTELTWKHTGGVDIKVSTPANPDGTLFASGGMTGSVETGKWVGDGTVFMLYDAATQELLASVPVNATVLGCVGNAPGAPVGAAGAQHTNWLDHPSRAVCGSCHSDIDFENGVGHVEVSNDNSCIFCHEPGIGDESGRSITGAHFQLYRSVQFPGVIVEFLEITNTGPGEYPTVLFSVNSKNGGIDPNTMNRLRMTITGPNEDFSYYNQETVNGGGASWVSEGVWSYTFKEAIPNDAEGSYTVSVEGRADATVNGGNQRDVLEATLLPFAVTDSAAVPRRMVVDDEKCESCHVALSLHGGGRNNANYCVTCHAPEATDEEELQEGATEQSIHFKYMIHSIHMGEERANPYIVAGHNQSVHDYGEVVYPGDLRNCDGCHVNDSQQLSLPAGLLPTTTPQEWWSPMQPVSAACLSCHNSDYVAVHAYTNMSFFGESCETCHGEGKEYAVDKVHAQ
jgi:hypothetical protein